MTSWFDDDGEEGSNGIFPEQFVVHADADGYEMVASASGPAGSVEVHIDRDVTVSVDFVEPGRATSVSVDGTEVPPVVVDLIGAARSSRLQEHLRSGSRRARRIEAPEGRDRRRVARAPRSSLDFQAEQDAREISKVAILESLATDERLDDVTRAAALLESARDRIGLGRIGSMGDHRIVDAAVAAAARLLVGADDDLQLLVDEEPFLALEFEKALAQFSRSDIVLRRAMDRLHPPSDRFEMAQAEMMAPPDLMLGEDVVDIDVFRRPRIDLSPGGLLTVRTREMLPDHWVRVVHKGPMVLLALVPLLDDPDRHGRGIAHAVLGAGFDLEQLDVEITDSPLPEPRSTIDRVAHAVALGREAAMLMAVDDDRSFRLWRACANAWDGLGDARRARLARQYADDGHEYRRQPFLAERVDAVLRSASDY